MSNQVAQYRLLKIGDSTIEKTTEILNNLDALNGEIVAGSNNNDVTDYIVEPVYVKIDDTNKSEQRYFLKAKIHDFDYVGYLIHGANTEATDPISGSSLAGKYITAMNFEVILANSKLYDPSTMALLKLTISTDGKKLTLLADKIEVNITVLEEKDYGNYAQYNPETNEFTNNITAAALSNISRQITFVSGDTLYACSAVDNGSGVYNMVPMSQVSATNQ